MRMKQLSSFTRYVDIIKKEDFITIFSLCEPGKWFSSRELQAFSFPNNAGSLAGRYLIKKTIHNYVKEQEFNHEIEILNNELGKPEVLLGENILALLKLAGIKKIHCSISHSRNFITAMTIFCY
jgi:phosphopantetheinyl transferase (holo-ACP synthase)